MTRQRRYCRACDARIGRGARACPFCHKLNLKAVDYALLLLLAVAVITVLWKL